MGALSKKEGDAYLFGISEVLNRISVDVRDAAMTKLAHGSAAKSLSDTEAIWQDADAAKSVAAAEQLYSERRRRDRIFSAYEGVFSEHTYDLLLYLYAANHRRLDVSVSSACHAACAPPTTGLREISRLEKIGLLKRRDDPFDRRRQNVYLTDVALQLMQKFLDGMAAQPRAA